MKKNKQNKNNVKRKILAYLLTPKFVKELKISVEHGKVVTTLNIIKH